VVAGSRRASSTVAAMTRAAAPPAMALRSRLTRLGNLSDRQRTWGTLALCFLLVLLMRAPYWSVALGRDEGGLSYVAKHWDGLSLYGDYWVDRPPLLLAMFKVAMLGGDHGLRALGAVAAIALIIAITLLARAVAGPRAGRIAAVLAALMAGSATLGAVYTPGELLASVPSTLSVLCLVLAHHSRRTRYVIAAGALAVTAVLVKQSFLDAGAAGAAFIVASAVSDREVRIRWPLMYAAGAVLPLIATLLWLAVAGVSLSYFVYTMFGFRLDLLHTLASSSIPLQTRVKHLRIPAWDSGLELVLIGALAGLVPLRRDRVLLVTFTVWLAAAAFGVLGGGSYFMHYLIELVAVGCVGAAAALANTWMPIRIVAVGAVAWLALTAANDAAVLLDHHKPHRREIAIGHYIRDHARAGDTQYVMYARSNVVYYAGLRQPYPYLWSLMVRVRPGARARLERLFASPERPTWLVKWQPADRWGLDPDGHLGSLLRRNYRRVAVVCGRPIFLRSDYAAPPGFTKRGCAR
jgi:Dolichyl-phosphate-mannose-protein mannosyltransferase